MNRIYCDHFEFLKFHKLISEGHCQTQKCPWCAPRPEEKSCEHDKGSYWAFFSGGHEYSIKNKEFYPTCPFCRPEPKEFPPHECMFLYKTDRCGTCGKKRPEPKEEFAYNLCAKCGEQIKLKPEPPQKSVKERLLSEMKGVVGDGYITGCVMPQGKIEELAEIALEFFKEIMPSMIMPLDDYDESGICRTEGYNNYRLKLLDRLNS